MKESGSEINRPELSLRAVKFIGVVTIMLVSSIVAGKVMRVVDPPETYYRMELKSQPPKDGIPQVPVLELTKQCVDLVVHAAPSGAGKTFYKDCE